MRLEGDSVVVKEVGEYFVRAERGYKPNVQRILSPQLHAEMMERRPAVKHIRVYNESGLEFQRELTDKTCIMSGLGGFLWCFSWRHDESATNPGVRR